MPEHAHLPTVQAFHVEGEGHALACRVTLTTGRTAAHFLPPSSSPVLIPTPDGGAVFIPELTHPDGYAYHLPARILPAFRAALPFQAVTA